MVKRLQNLNQGVSLTMVALLNMKISKTGCTACYPGESVKSFIIFNRRPKPSSARPIRDNQFLLFAQSGGGTVELQSENCTLCNCTLCKFLYCKNIGCILDCTVYMAQWVYPHQITALQKGAGSFHIHRKTMKDLGILAVLGVREQPNLAHNLVTHRY